MVSRKKKNHNFYLPGCPSPTDSDVNKNVSPSSISNFPLVFEDPLVAWAGILILFLMRTDLEWEKNHTDLTFYITTTTFLKIMIYMHFLIIYTCRQTKYQLGICFFK